MTPHVVVVGSTMIDLVAYADPLPAPGQTVVGDGFALGYGGKGANQAVMAARLGAQVTFVNRVGDDLFGRMVRANLIERDIDVSRVKTVAEQATGVAPIWVQRDGTNRIIVVPGANGALSAGEVEADLANVAKADCVVCQLEIPLDAVVASFRWGRACDAITILNPAPAASLSEEVLDLADWIVPNESEFEVLFDRVVDDDTILEAAAALRGRIVVTLGEQGCATVIDGAVVHVAAPTVKPVDTTGAGDAFIAGFADGLARGEPLLATLAFANRCGALSTTRQGTQSSFPTVEEVNTARQPA